jgi:hypothetical protein
VRCWASEVMEHLGGDLFGSDTSPEGASIDSRTIRLGQTYVPIVAERHGQNFIPAELGAARRGMTDLCPRVQRLVSRPLYYRAVLGGRGRNRVDGTERQGTGADY